MKRAPRSLFQRLQGRRRIYDFAGIAGKLKKETITPDEKLKAVQITEEGIVGVENIYTERSQICSPPQAAVRAQALSVIKYVVRNGNAL